MAYLIKVGDNTSYWSGNPEAVFVDQVSTALQYATKKAAQTDLDIVAKDWGYSTLVVVSVEGAPSAELPEEELNVAPVVELTVDEMKRINS